LTATGNIGAVQQVELHGGRIGFHRPDARGVALHLLDVLAGLERHLLGVRAGLQPVVDVAGPPIVGHQRQPLVAVVLVEVLLEVLRAAGMACSGVEHVLGHAEILGGARHDLHQAAGAGLAHREAVHPAALLRHHARDQRRPHAGIAAAFWISGSYCLTASGILRPT
jgi:hypothetical protein